VDRITPTLLEDVMSSQRPSIRLKLTKEQQEEVRKATGKNAEAIELSIEELEARIAPKKMF